MRSAAPESQPPCWQTIGVWGRAEPRCPELERVVHCRNCEVFRQAGTGLFDREPPADYGVGWGDALARLKRDARERPVLVFRLGGELFALRLEVLVSVSAWRTIRAVPDRRDEALLGLVNVDGELQLCVSLEVLFDLPRPGPGSRPPGRMLVIGDRSAEWVVPVDETVSLRDVVLDSLAPVPATLQRSASPYVRGLTEWRDRPVGVLDDELLLGSLRRRLA